MRVYARCLGTSFALVYMALLRVNFSLSRAADFTALMLRVCNPTSLCFGECHGITSTTTENMV